MSYSRSARVPLEKCSKAERNTQDRSSPSSLSTNGSSYTEANQKKTSRILGRKLKFYEDCIMKISSSCLTPSKHRINSA
jgi:hypothetical protein